MDILFSRKNLAAAVALLGCIIMIAFPDAALLSAQKGIAVWAGSVLPALLPFFICAGFMNVAGVSSFLPGGLYVFFMSVFSGYPMGARIIGDMRRSGEITLRQAERMIPLGSTTGPAFIFGAVGAGMLSSVKAGTVIAEAHYGAALITAFLVNIVFLSGKRKEKSDKREHRQRTLHGQQACNDKSILEMFTDSILEALKSLGIILAYIVIFMFITDMMQKTLMFSSINSPALRALGKGVLEMTVGCSSLSEAGIPAKFQITAASFMISFGGFSVIGQSMSMLSGSGVRFSYFLMVKLIHGVIAAAIAYLLVF